MFNGKRKKVHACEIISLDDFERFAITAVGDHKMHGTYQQYETTGNSCKEIFFTGNAQMQFSYSKMSISVT